MRRKPKRPTELICRIDMTALLSIQVALLFTFMAAINGGGDLPMNDVDLATVVHSVPMRGALREDAMIVAVQRDGRVWLGNLTVSPGELPAHIREAVNHGAERRVYIRADMRAKYGEVLEVLGGVRSAGIANVGFLVGERNVRTSP
jgi:biopolymer transport protein TolR